MDTTGEKKLKAQKKSGLPLWTAEEILREGRSRSQDESPIDLSFNIMKEIRLPPIEWVNFDVPPKLLKISNSGSTAILSGKWHGPRPYLANGAVSGQYVFSQLHFHWGRSFQEGSEHRINGEALPLEAHAMFFKNVYFSKGDAMKKADGIITLAYFFHLQEEDNENLTPITAALPAIASPLTSQHIENAPLKQFILSFSNDYFLYWGNVTKMSVLWFICRKPLGISAKQLSLFKNLIGSDEKPIEKNFREPRDLNQRVVFHVNPSENKLHPLLPKDDVKRKDSKLQGKVQKIFSLVRREDSEELLTVAQQGEGRQNSFRISNEVNYFQKEEEKAVNMGDSENKEDSATDILNFSLKKQPNVKELKYTLARILLELEKKENDDDFGVLQNYIKAKYAGAPEMLRKKENSLKGTDEPVNELKEIVGPTNNLGKENLNVNTCESTIYESTEVKETDIDLKADENNKYLYDQCANKNVVQNIDYTRRNKFQNDEPFMENNKRSSNKMAPDNEVLSRKPSKEFDKSKVEGSDIPRTYLKGSRSLQTRPGRTLASRISSEEEETLGIPKTTKSNSISVLTQGREETGESDDNEESIKSHSSGRSCEDNIKNNVMENNMKEIKSKLWKRKSVTTSGGGIGSKNNMEMEKTGIQKHEVCNPTSLQGRDNTGRGKKSATLQKLIARINKGRPPRNKTNPITPDRPVWKP